MDTLKSISKYAVQLALISAMSIYSFSASAEELKKVDAEALDKTVEMLNNRQQREEYANQSEQSKKADKMAKDLFGAQGADKAYAAAAEILKTMVQQTNGDPAAMQKMMNDAQKNPEAFMKSLSSEHQNMIRKLAEDVEATSATGAPKK